MRRYVALCTGTGNSNNSLWRRSGENADCRLQTADCRLQTVDILVPRAHDPFGLRQGLRPLAGTEAGSPRITDFRLLCAASEI